MENTLTGREIQEARQRIGKYIRRTPLLDSPTLSQRLGCQIYLKAETLQRTGSFKLRGALNKTLQLSQEELDRGLIAGSAGNHAQGLAYAGRLLGAKTLIVMPADAPQLKVENTRAMGAQVELLDLPQPKRYEYIMNQVQEHGYTMVHAYDDYQIMAGQGTIGLEVLEDLPQVDTIVVPVGGGGLISGIAVAAKSVNPKVRIVGAEPALAPKGHESRRLGRQVTVTAGPTMADGIKDDFLGKKTYPLMEQYVDEMVLASEESIAQAMRLLCSENKLAVEGAGAVGLAALLDGNLKVQPEEKVCFVLSGGNWEPSRLAAIYSGADHL